MYLCEYSKSGKIVEVAQLLIANGIDVNHTNRWGSNAPMHLCQHSCSDKIVEVAQLLTENGTDVKQTNEEGRNNALILLCAQSENEKIIEIAQLLISNGIDVNQMGVFECNALMWLCWNSKNSKIVEMAQLLINPHSCNSEIMAQVTMLTEKTLVANGIDVNKTDKNGDNALMLLCTESKNDNIVEVAQLLIANGQSHK